MKPHGPEALFDMTCCSTFYLSRGSPFTPLYAMGVLRLVVPTKRLPTWILRGNPGEGKGMGATRPGFPEGYRGIAGGTAERFEGGDFRKGRGRGGPERARVLRGCIRGAARRCAEGEEGGARPRARAPRPFRSCGRRAPTSAAPVRSARTRPTLGCGVS